MQDVENDTQVRENAITSKMLQMKGKVIQGASQEASPTLENHKTEKIRKNTLYVKQIDL